MSVQVQALYDEIVEMLLEDTGFATLGIMSNTDFFNYLVDIYQDFLQRTHVIKQAFLQNLVADTGVYTEPNSAMDVQFVAANDGYVARSSGWYIDNLDANWQNIPPGVPERWREDALAPKQIQLEPQPYASVTNGLLLIASAQPSSYPSSLTSYFSFIPDSFTIFIKYGILWKILSGDTEYKNLAQANYCKTRYMEGVQLLEDMMSELEMEVVR